MATNGARTCSNCGSDIPADFIFCGKCGARVDGGVAAAGAGAAAKTMYFGGSPTPARAKLIVIKGEGVDGVSYQLAGSEHLAGRLDGAILFPDDPLMSPRHANFIYRDGRLSVRDEGSVNGVFTRIKEPTRIPSGGLFLIGEQLLQVEPSPPDLGPQPDAEGTYFYASPKRPSKMKLIQRLRGGEIGMIYRARGESITIGREGNDVNFLDDPFISGRHAQVEITADGQMSVSDLGSKNGTFVRIEEETQLTHGDYVFLGQQLLRVEIA